MTRLGAMTAHHFELKVPGGKLIVVDVDAQDNIISKAQVSGDFFLDPEEAYDAISPAFEGCLLYTSPSPRDS